MLVFIVSVCALCSKCRLVHVWIPVEEYDQGVPGSSVPPGWCILVGLVDCMLCLAALRGPGSLSVPGLVYPGYTISITTANHHFSSTCMINYFLAFTFLFTEVDILISKKRVFPTKISDRPKWSEKKRAFPTDLPTKRDRS